MAVKKKKARKKAPVARAAQQSDLKEKQRYIKGYQQVLQNLYKKGSFSREQARLADLAYKNKLPPSAFVGLIRKKDPQYARTQDFRVRQQEAKQVWGKARPNRPMPQEFAARYVHSSMKREQLIDKVTQGLKAQQASSFKVSQNKQAYAQMRAMMNDSFRARTGKDAPNLLHDMVFSAKLRDQHIEDQYPDLFGGKAVFGWMDPKKQNQMPTRSFRSAAVTAPTRKQSMPSLFLDNMQNQFGIGVEDLSASLISSEIK